MSGSARRSALPVADADNHSYEDWDAPRRVILS
jgi:hypothetical protein